MEIRQYFKIITNRWWIIAAAFIVTLIPTFVMVNRQPWIYESKTTFVIRPRASFAANEEEFVKAVDTLSRRVEINTTFAEVADSRLIKQRALDRLELSPLDRTGLKVIGKVRAGTNVLEIIVQGPNPGIVRDFADAVSVETREYVSNLYDVFELEPLDLAKISNNPISPNKPLNIWVGGAFGLLLGISLVFLFEYLREPLGSHGSFNVIDGETGLYNGDYFNLRVIQELSRVKNKSNYFSLALVKINYRYRTSGLVSTAPPSKSSLLLSTSVLPNLRDEDLLAHLGESNFAFLLPNMDAEESSNLFEALHIRISSLLPDDIGETIHCSIGIIAYEGGETTSKRLLTWVFQALEEAGEDTQGKVVLYVTADGDQPSITHADGSEPGSGKSAASDMETLEPKPRWKVKS